jgi:excisionase family DNA binding protein
MDASDVGGDLLTAGEVAKQAGVSDESVRQWAKRGRLPHVRAASGAHGALYLFRQADVDRFLAERAALAKDRVEG